MMDNDAITPHPNPLPLGEGVRSQPLQQRALSHRDRVRGESLNGKAK
jgi:hypothetical protein